MTFRCLGAVLLGSASLAGCSHPERSIATANVGRFDERNLEASWSLQKLGGSKVRNPRALILELRSSGVLSGSLACNQFSGTWTYGSGVLSLKAEEITTLGCSLGAIENQRSQLMALIGSGGAAKLSNGLLVIRIDGKAFEFRKTE